MNMTFKAFDVHTGGYFDWTITDNKITYKGKTILLSSLLLVEYDANEPKINGRFTFYFGKGSFGNVCLSFPMEDKERAQEVSDFLLNLIGEDKFIVFGEEPRESRDEKIRKIQGDPMLKLKIVGIISAIIIAIVLIALVVSSFNEGLSRPSNNDRPTYDDVFDKDPNNWTDEEKEYVDDFFGWMEKNK